MQPDTRKRKGVAANVRAPAGRVMFVRVIVATLNASSAMVKPSRDGIGWGAAGRGYPIARWARGF